MEPGEAKILKIEDNGRVGRLRAKVLRVPEICIERGYLLTQSYKETEGEPTAIRRARAFKKILQEMTIGIGDEELIVGKGTTKERGGALVPEVQWKWYLDEMDIMSTRDYDRFAPIPEDDKVKMKEFLPYWKGQSLFDRWHATVPENSLKLKGVFEVPTGSCLNTAHLAHACPDYERVINKGLNDVTRQVEAELTKLNLADVKDFEKYQFLSAIKITLEASIIFARRYADLAGKMAQQESDPQRKLELEKIAEMCNQVPANPARSFHEAIQTVWFIYIFMMVEGWGVGLNFGRADQYLYPFYKKDLDQGRLTREEALILISLFYIKANGVVVLHSAESVKAVAGFPTHANITLGGLTKEGRDAVNDLSFLFLEAEGRIGLTAEDFIIRVHKNTPESFLMKACETAKLLRGKLKFLSDETAIQQLLTEGKPIEYARNYIINGCNDLTVPGVSHDLGGHKLNLPLILEYALNNGVSRLNGKQIGPQTGDPRKFKSYEEVWEAYKKQVEAALPVMMLFRNIDRMLFSEFTPTPFKSALYKGCIEKGLDIGAGGTAPYLAQYTALSGIPNVGDSLAAIKKVVFEDKKITMDRLIEALEKNFEGEDEVLFLLKKAPKFGNDDDYADSIVNDIIVHGSNEISKFVGLAGRLSNTCAGIVTSNVTMGFKVGALPDGRKAHEALAEGGISPYQGRNINGPTATLRSVAKLDHLKLTGGSVLNMRFNPEVLKDEAKMGKFASLIRTFCETGGYLIQFNIINTETLKEAQAHPEKYRDLLVRVATYSAYFVELSPVLQNDIIARMEFEEL